MIRVFIDGSEGTTGLRIFERFSARGDVELLRLGEAERKDTAARKEMLNACDLAFLCLPDAAAREAASLIENPAVRVIDSSTAHRTAQGWAYGFPELSPAHREAVRNGRRVAAPGCHASGFIALVYPLVQAGLLEKEAQLSCFSLTGYSGGGRKMIARYEDAGRPSGFGAWKPYAMGQTHKHLREMCHVSGLAHPPVFSPILGDFHSGMLVSVPLWTGLLAKKADLTDIRDVYAAHYANEPLVRVTDAPEDGSLAADALAGFDYMEICAAGGEGRFTLNARFDNLGKGASGATIQCMNCMLGLDESTGLHV